MNLADMFSAEDRVSVKFSDFYALMSAAAKAEAKAALMENAVKCDVPHRYIRESLTGVSEKISTQAVMEALSAHNAEAEEG